MIDELQVISWSMPELAPRTKWEMDQRHKPDGRIGLTCLSAGQRWIVAGSRAGLVYLVRGADGQPVNVFSRRARRVQCIALSSDESLIVPAACLPMENSSALFNFPPAIASRSTLPTWTR